MSHPSSSSSSSSFALTSMGLDDHDDHPRRFLNWQGEFLLAYGGDDGTLTMAAVERKTTSTTITTKASSTSRSTTAGTSTSATMWIKVRQWDDAIRAIVISPDGKRVAVGFETGATTIYVYDDYQIQPHEPHPFFKAAWQKWQRRRRHHHQQPHEDNNNNKSNDDDDDQGLLSQSLMTDALIDMQQEAGDAAEEEHSFPGPPMAAPIRDLQFDPRCSSSSSNSSNNSHSSSSSSSKHAVPYFLAIACEAGFCVSNVTSANTVLPLYLQDVGEKEHDASGIRGLCYMTNTNSSNKNDNSNNSSDSTYLATLAMDGRLCVWNVTNWDDPELDWELHHRDITKCITKPDVGELNGADAADRSSRPISALSSYLALPGQTDVVLRPQRQLSRETFIPSLNGQGHLEPIVAVTTTESRRGRHHHEPYLITSGRDGRVNLWRLPTSQDDKDKKEEQSRASATGSYVTQIGHFVSIPTDLCWMSTQGESGGSVLYVACANGTCATITNVEKFIPQQLVEEELDEPDQVDKTRSMKPSKSRITNTHARAEGHKNKKTSSEALTSPLPKMTKKNMYVDDEAEDDDDDGDLPPAQHSGGNYDDQEDDDEATVDLAIAIKASAATAMTSHSPNRSITDEARESAMDDGYGYDNDDDDDDGNLPYDHEPRSHALSLRLPEPQAAFAPSSTPLDLARRIMCWNHIGVISFLRGDDDLVRNMVSIEFTDVTARRPASFTDNMNFILGALGDEGAIFASDLQDDEADDDDVDADLVDGINISERTKAMVLKSQRQRMKKDHGAKSTGSSIFFHRFETFGNRRDKDWFWSLPDGERALGCACGEGWAAVATSRRFLRFFTVGGNQGQVVWLNGDLVTMVGRTRFLAVFFHESNPLMDGTQKLGFAMFDAVACRVVAHGSVSGISKRSSLSWAGFSNDMSLMVMDTDGMLSMLICTADSNGPLDAITPSSWEWTPILDTVGLRKSAEHSIWPIAVQDGKLVCVPLKGGNKYPDATRRPVTTTLSLRMPLARGGAVDKMVTLEELSVRANMALGQKRAINYLLISNPVEKEEFEDEYQSMCVQVDKVTLNLFLEMLKAGKLERALDLVRRLHLEKSFEIAITMADRLNHRGLSDRIEEVKERWLSMQAPDQLDEDEEDFVGMEDYEELHDGKDDELDFGGEEESVTEQTNHVRSEKATNGRPAENTMLGSVRRISPDSHRTTKKRSLDDGTNEKKPKNPFAKKRLASPAHKSNLVASSPGLSSPKPKISRSSTFSTKSREQTKASKNIL